MKPNQTKIDTQIQRIEWWLQKGKVKWVKGYQLYDEQKQHFCIVYKSQNVILYT